MRIQAIREIGFDAGHRVFGHESKCATFHGHRYKAEIFCEADDLDRLGRVIDFSVIKTKVGAWIDKHWDHAMIVWHRDSDLEKIQACSGFKPVFVSSFNPTAENLAKYLLEIICPLELYASGVKVTKIILWETPNCKVEVSL